MNINANFLLASLVWGSIGIGYFIYGRRAQSMIPLIGGLLLIAISYCVASALWMSAAGFFIMAAVYWLLRMGY